LSELRDDQTLERRSRAGVTAGRAGSGGMTSTLAEETKARPPSASLSA
jgi:hypothetical protein